MGQHQHTKYKSGPNKNVLKPGPGRPRKIDAGFPGMVRKLIKKFCLEHDMNLEEFATRLGVSRQEMHYCLTHQRPMRFWMAKDLAEILNLPLSHMCISYGLMPIEFIKFCRESPNEAWPELWSILTKYNRADKGQEFAAPREILHLQQESKDADSD